jgi:hypothetical protein
MYCAYEYQFLELGALLKKDTMTHAHGFSVQTEEQQPEYDAAEAGENRKIAGSLGVIPPMGVPVLVDTLNSQERDIGV